VGFRQKPSNVSSIQNLNMIAKPSLIHLAGCALAVSAFVPGWKPLPAAAGLRQGMNEGRDLPQTSALGGITAGSGEDISASGKKATAADSPTIGQGSSARDLLAHLGKHHGLLTEDGITALGGIFCTSTGPLPRHEAFSRLLPGLTKENTFAIRNPWGTPDPMDPVFRDFHFTWGKTAGIEAVMSGVGTDAPDRGPSLAGWASADPAAASAWLRNLELSDSAYDPLIKVRGLANTNPPENPWDFRDIALPWAGKSPSRAIGWLESLGDSRGRNEGMSAAYAFWASKDDVTASQSLVNTPPSTSKDYAINGFVTPWVRRDPEAARIWVG
jgi:hypothetical protein